MATIYGAIKGINLLRESIGGSSTAVALVTFVMPAYTASSDNGQLGGGGFDRGTATTDSLATIIQKERRDGKTVTLQNTTVGLALCVEPGRQSTTDFYAGTFAVSSGSMTFNLTNSSGTEIDAASGVSDKPVTVLVAYTLS